jgi:tetratricopeptide (TPR) repeat protein
MSSYSRSLIFCAALISSAAPAHAIECAAVNQQVLVLVAKGRRTDAELLLKQLLPQVNPLDRGCEGVTLSNLSALLLTSGRPAQAERFAMRSVQVLEEAYSPNDPALLRPLHILASIRIELGNIGQARQAFRRMQSIPANRPDDRGHVSAMAASLLMAEGRWKEAESHYAAALQDLKSVGRENSADAGSLLNALGLGYFKEGRWSEARRIFDQALAIFERVRDADPWDRAKLLCMRGALRARQHEWAEAEQDLADALAIADHESRMEPAMLRPLLSAYLDVLRKNHRRGEARSIQARIAALGPARNANGPVDVAELLATKRSRTN